jgi:3-dehydroquinate synthase
LNELGRSGFQVFTAVVPAGEESKAMARAEKLYTAAIKAGLERGDMIVALGGGVVGDLAGFVAATYLRGVPFVQVPTTLLAQVDSSVGGKVAVNHPLGKNLIGAFYQPRLVWIDLAVLDTLPVREFLAGAAEVVKYSVILSEPFFCYLEDNWTALLAGETAVLTRVVETCCSLKAGVVAEDERDEGIRAILNFGHTLGHALEAVTEYGYYLHGEAVLVGMSLATKIAVRKKHLNKDDAERILALLARAGFRQPPSGLRPEQVEKALWLDKKREKGRLVFVLPVSIGKVERFTDVDSQTIREVLDEYLKDN